MKKKSIALCKIRSSRMNARACWRGNLSYFILTGFPCPDDGCLSDLARKRIKSWQKGLQNGRYGIK
jgi:hypothetical protein